MFVVTLAIVLAAMSSTETSNVKVCSCCVDPARYRGFEKDNKCYHIAIPRGVLSTPLQDEAVPLDALAQYISDYPDYGFKRVLKLNSTTYWDTTKNVRSEPALGEHETLRYVIRYTNYIETTDQFIVVHEPCCDRIPRDVTLL